jgi:hypothetical protein
MIVGFSRHGKGGGKGPTQYITDTQREGRDNAPPDVLRGDPDNTRRLIDSLAFKHKYTSGVLSFAPGETITPEMENKIMDRFEQVAFAGLEQDQYNILWVRHTHANHHELHFVTPRVELSTGKSLNIKPPGTKARQHFDDFRSEVNARYGLADPTDPSRERNVKNPDHELKIAAEALRRGEKPEHNIRDLIDSVLTQRAEAGLICNRDDVTENVKDLGLEITREGKDYITVQEPESSKKWRLKGPLYARDYKPSRTIEAADQARERDYSRPDPTAAKRYAQRVERHIEARAEYHQSRYQRPDKQHRLEHDKEQSVMANHHRPDFLAGHLRRELGNNAISVERDSDHESDSPTARKTGRQVDAERLRGSSLHSGGEERGDVDKESRQSPPVHPRRILDAPKPKMLENEDHDGIRENLARRLRSTLDRARKASQRIAALTGELVSDVRAYFTREHTATKASRALEQSSHQLERETPRIERVIQQEQTLARTRRRHRSHDRGPSLG